MSKSCWPHWLPAPKKPLWPDLFTLLHSLAMNYFGCMFPSTAARLTQVALLLLLALTFCLSTSPIAWAQNEDTTEPEKEELWYQVEVFIFANDNPTAGYPEIWPEQVELAYPKRILQLSDPGESAIEPTAEMTPPLLSNEAVAPIGRTEEPFTLLEEDKMELRQIAARIARQKDFRTLFHKAWRQPASGREESESVLVRGGDRYGDHRELEGWINLSVERYLHFKTDLWLSTFKSTAGLDYLPWPKLPRMPVTSIFQQRDNPTQGFAASDWSNRGADNSFFTLRPNPYMVDTTVVLRQSRRMRSGELHYIDHPLMGILVKAIPYQPEAIEALPEVAPEEAAPDLAETLSQR